MSLAPQRAQAWPDAAPRAVGDLRRITVTWQLHDWFDHYRVLGAPVGADGATGSPVLLGVTRTNAFVHEGRDPDGECWQYTLIGVGPGQRTCVTTPMVATSLPSATGTGRPLAVVGRFDDAASDLALSGSAYARYRSVFAGDVDFLVGRDVPSQDWSWVHPGPEDAWAGRRPHRFRLRFHLDEPPRGDLDLALWLTDRHPQHPGTATLSLNGRPLPRLIFEGQRGDSPAHGVVPGRGAGPAHVERRVCGTLFRPGENVLDITKDSGSWIAYDAVGIFG